MNLRNFSSAEKNEDQPDGRQMIEEAAKKYENMSEDELIGRLISQVKSAKESGTFDGEKIKQYITMVSPYMDEKQTQKLTDLLQVIDSGKI